MVKTCYSRGNINAPIMIIGEAPGKEELNHEVGGVAMPIPFSGESGILVHQIIQWLDLSEGDFILTNILKSRPTDANGRPHPISEEMILGTDPDTVGSRDTLLQEIHKVNPKIILLLGKPPVWSLFYYKSKPYELLRMGNINGIIHYLHLNNKGEQVASRGTDIKTIAALPIYHPAAIIRDKEGDGTIKDAIYKTLIKNKETFSDAIGRIMI